MRYVFLHLVWGLVAVFAADLKLLQEHQLGTSDAI